MFTLSVLIVNFNAGSTLPECIFSVLSSKISLQVLIFDNGSTDDSVALVRGLVGIDHRVTIIESSENLGFAAGINAMLEYIQGNMILILNPDCIIQLGALERMLAVLARFPEAGMAGCLIRNPDGSEQRGCRRYLPTPTRALARVLNLDRFSRRFQGFDLTGTPLPPGPVPVEAISGAFMLVRRSTIERIGPLDEGYFLHCEDLDWCMRAKLANIPVLFVPDVEVYHAQGTSSAGRPVRVEFYKHQGMIRYYRKFFRDQYPAPLMALVVGAVWARFAAKAVVLTLRRLLKR